MASCSLGVHSATPFMASWLAPVLVLAGVVASSACSSSGSDENANDGTGATSPDGDGSGGGSGDGTSTGGASGTSTGDGADGATPAGGAVALLNVNILAEVPPQPGAEQGTPADTSVQGFVYDKAPIGDLRDLAGEEGDCKVLTPKDVFCEPVCELGFTCGEDSVCVADETAISAGDFTVTGLEQAGGATEFTMSPLSPNKPIYQMPGSVDLVYPPCGEGDTVSFAASGDTVPAFTAESTCVSTLGLPAGEVELVRDQELTLTWTAPATVGLTRAELNIDISHHGGFRGEIVCDAEDTGSLTVPGSLVTKLIDLGYSGFPSMTLTRVAVNTVTFEGGYAIVRVLSRETRMIAMEGLESCLSDNDCSDGKTCADDLKCVDG